MRRIYTSWGAGAALGWFVLAAGAASAGLPQDLRATLSKLPDAKARVGACVIDLSNGQAVFTLNGDAPMTP